MVKSAERAFAILEYLRQCQASTLGDIATGLALPKSSAFMLLKSMVGLGYLLYSPQDHTYRPSYRVALLGEGFEEGAILGEGPLMEALNRLHRATAETVVVGLQNGAYVQYIHLISDSRRLMQRLPVGRMRLMAYNTSGKVLLAGLDDKRVRSIIRHNNANWLDPTTRLSEAALLAQVKRVRNEGFCTGRGHTWPDATLLAIAIRPSPDMPPLSVSVGGLHKKGEPPFAGLLAPMHELLAPWLATRSS